MGVAELRRLLSKHCRRTGHSLGHFSSELADRSSDVDAPKRDELLILITEISANGAAIDTDEASRILEAAGDVKPLAAEETEMLSRAYSEGQWSQRKGSLTLTPMFTTDKESDAEEFRESIAELSRRLSELADSQEQGEQSDTLNEVRDLVNSVEAKGKELTAPIRIPAPEDLEVKLIAANTLDRLQEYVLGVVTSVLVVLVARVMIRSRRTRLRMVGHESVDVTFDGRGRSNV
jgi:hypothetical protein